MAADTPGFEDTRATDAPLSGTPDTLETATKDPPRLLFQTPNLRLPHFRQATPAPAPPHAHDRQASAALDDLYHTAQDLQNAYAEQTAMLARISAALDAALDLARKAARPDLLVSFPLRANQPYILDTQDRKHVFLLLTATQTVKFDIPGVGTVSRSLNGDWNRLDYPDKTTIYLATEPASPVNALLRLSDDIINV